MNNSLRRYQHERTKAGQLFDSFPTKVVESKKLQKLRQVSAVSEVSCVPTNSDTHKSFREPDFLRLFLQHEESLRAYARTLLPSWEAVDDVLQESSVVMWRKLDQIAEEDGFLPWAKVIVRYEALKVQQKRVRDRHVFSEDVLQLLAAEEDGEPAEALQSEWKALNHCLGKLSEAERELVMAPYSGRGRITEMAEQSGRSVNSLYKRIGRLREKLGICVEHQLLEQT